MIFAWTFVLSLWLALLLLILHDATRDDSDGGAISVAAKNFNAFIDLTTQKARTVSKVSNYTHSQTSAPKPPTNAETATRNSPSSSEPIPQPSEIEQVPIAAPTKKSWRNGGRVSITIPELELTIVRAVRSAAPECETFIGVVLQQTTPRSRRDANWQLLGAKFGTADRKIANEALTTIIERMQREFYLTER